MRPSFRRYRIRTRLLGRHSSASNRTFSLGDLFFNLRKTGSESGEEGEEERDKLNRMRESANLQL